MNGIHRSRVDKILWQCIEESNLDLRGLTVFTEAATGPYLYTPIMAALANARKVYAVTADSRFGSREQVKQQTLEAAAEWGVADQIEVIFYKAKEYIEDSDIITNSGFVRPIERQMISWMKSTAVIPLMWEPWEFRGEDLDLQACKEHDVLVMGTNESEMYPYSGHIAMKLLFGLGLEGYGTKVLLLGSAIELTRSIYRHFVRAGMDITWVADHSRLREHFWRCGSDYDAVILAEHTNDVCLLGKEGLLTYEQIKQVNPVLCIGIIAGNLDIDGLKSSGLRFFPEVIRPFGYMSYQAYHLGPRPVLELYAAGLKVGEAMARARLQGMNIEKAKEHALKSSLAMDF